MVPLFICFCARVAIIDGNPPDSETKLNTAKSYSAWWLAFAIPLCLTPCLVFLLTAGRIEGEEFSPDNFTRRRFSYNVMPFFGYVVSGIQYSDSTTQLETSLLAGGFVNSASKPKKWHLIWDNVSNQNSSDFNAKLLVDYLDLTDENYQSVWFQWNKDHPKSAIEFWPVIAELSREQLYLDVADIMHKALSLKAGRSEQRFQSYMWDQACDALNTKAVSAVNAGLLPEAVRLYSVSLQIRENQPALLGRAKVYKTLGNREKSSADLKSAADFE